MALQLDRRRILWIEFAVVLTLFWLPVTVTGVVHYIYPSLAPARTGWEDEVGRLLSNLAVIVPVLFIAYASGDDLASFGLKKCSFWKAALFAFVALAMSLVATRLVHSSLRIAAPGFLATSNHIAHVNIDRLVPSTPLWIARMHLFFFGAFEEELVWRGYALVRLTELLGRRWVALLVSTTLFTVYHIYEGPAVLPSIFLMGLIFGFVRIWGNSLIPGTIGHALFNCFSLIMRGS